MKYLIIRKRPDAGDNPFMEMVAAGGGGPDFQLPYETASQELRDRDVGDLRRDASVEVVVNRGS